MFLIRGFVFSYEAVRDWEAKLTPALADDLRRRRKGKVGRSWYVDETYIKVRGRCNNRLEQNHRGIKGRCRSMLGFKSSTSARRYCRSHDELRNFLRCRTRMRQPIPPATRRFHHMQRMAIALGILEAA